MDSFGQGESIPPAQLVPAPAGGGARSPFVLALVAAVAGALVAAPLAVGMVELMGAGGHASTHPSRTTTSGQVDLGAIWGRAFKGRARAYEPLAAAERQSNLIPPGAQVSETSDTIRFDTENVTLTIVANPPTRRNMAFRSAGLENPTIDVPRGARITIQFVNRDSDSAHGWLLLDPVAWSGNSPHGPRAFPGSSATILGDPTAKGQPMETIHFTASASGTYRYECPVPGHAAMGMQGRLLVSA